MDGSRRLIDRSLAMGLGALICAWAGGAAAQEYCVACTEPKALYRCVIDGAQPGGGQPLQLLCITAMAKDGGHATCSVKRGTVFECDGIIRRVPWTALNASEPQPAQPPVASPAPKSEPATAAKPEGPPQTVVEMAKRANEQTVKDMKQAGEKMKEGAKSVGETIGTVTKKTWDCMTSFFTRC
jgi:hypothetical protein